MAATTFYLRQGTAESVTTPPSAFLGTWTVATAAGNGASAKSLQQAAGASVLTVAVTTTAASDTAIQQYLSVPLAAQTIAAATWTVGFVMTGTVHNYQPRIYIGVVNGATGALRGSITAAAAVAVGTGTRVVTTKLTAYSAAITGSSVVVSNGDYLVVEIGATPSTSASTTLTAYADAATAITADSATNATPASFVQCPNAITIQLPVGAIAAVNNVPAASGMACQTHLVYAVNSALWWAFWFDSTATTSIKCASSPDLATWTAGADGTLAAAHGSEGRNLNVAYANSAGVDALHFAINHDVSSAGSNYFLRATVSGTTITWGTETAITSGITGIPANYGYPGPAVGVASTGIIHHASGYLGNAATYMGATVICHNATADTGGATWTPGLWVNQAGTTVPSTGEATDLFDSVGYHAGNAMIPLASGTMLLLSGNNPNSGGTIETDSLLTATGATGAWTTSTTLPATAFTSTFMGSDDWGWAARATTDVHVVVRNPTGNAFSHFRFNGTNWTAVPGASIPTHTSIGGTSTDTGGVALTTDGTSVWAFIIDSASGNSIYSCQWTSGSGWGAWTLVLGTSATRQYLACAHTMTSGTTALLWTEGAASPYSLVALAFPPASPSVVIPHPIIVSQAAKRAAVY